MLRDRVSSFWALEVACLGGSNPLSPLLFRRQPGAMFLGDRRSPVPLFLFLLGYSNHKPQPLPYSLYEGDVYVAPGLPYGNRRRWSELEGPQESAWRS